MPVFRNKKRTNFYENLKNITFKNINVSEKDFFKNTIKSAKEETEKILIAINKWEDDKQHTEKNQNEKYLKSKSQKHLNKIKKACKNLKNSSDDIRSFNKYLDELKNSLKESSEAKFGAFTFGAVLDDKKNQTKLKEISNSIDILTKKIAEAAKNITIGLHRKSTNNNSNPGIFRGLPNGDNYCYLNTALQALYNLNNFRNKVLESNPPETNAYKELRAVKFFFEYLRAEKMDDTHSTYFNNNRKNMAKILGYNGSQDNSIEKQEQLEKVCRNQMRTLKNKSSLEISETTSQTMNNNEKNKIKEKWNKSFCGSFKNDLEKENISKLTQIIQTLHNENTFKNKVLAIDINELTVKDLYNHLEATIKLFKLIDKNQIYSQDSYNILIDWIDKMDNKVSEYKAIKRYILAEIDSFNRSKRAHILSTDSKIPIIIVEKNVKRSLEIFLNDRRKENMAYYLPLKSNRFIIHLSDREPGSGNRLRFSTEETLDLTQFVENGQLKIFVKNNELKRRNYQFNLVSASIGTGSHYYIYVKQGSIWHCLNDNSNKTVKWSKIKDDINERSEALTYELK